MILITDTHDSHDEKVRAVAEFLLERYPYLQHRFHRDFPEWSEAIWTGARLDTEATGVEPEYVSWVADWFEETDKVTWSDGDAWAYPELPDVEDIRQALSDPRHTPGDPRWVAGPDGSWLILADVGADIDHERVRSSEDPEQYAAEAVERSNVASMLNGGVSGALLDAANMVALAEALPSDDDLGECLVTPVETVSLWAHDGSTWLAHETLVEAWRDECQVDAERLVDLSDYPVMCDMTLSAVELAYMDEVAAQHRPAWEDCELAPLVTPESLCDAWRYAWERSAELHGYADAWVEDFEAWGPTELAELNEWIAANIGEASQVPLAGQCIHAWSDNVCSRCGQSRLSL